MSWNDELYKIYELNCNREFDDNEPEMLPVSHSTVNAQIEVTINEDGEFKGVRPVEKKEAKTVIPNTGKAKTGINPPPYPMTECLKYVAGDFDKYKPQDLKDSFSLHQAYLEQLRMWNESEYSHNAVKAVLKYVSKANLIQDCMKSGVLIVEDETNLLKPKQYGYNVDKLFVRFKVNYNDPNAESRTWKDKTLYDSFISYNSKNATTNQLCYASGKILPALYVHPAQIIKTEAKAKLISTNDKDGYTYRGRFHNKEQAISISYEYSQKMHNALKWLIDKQGISIGSMIMIVWASALQPLPDVTKKIIDEDDPYQDEEDEVMSTYPEYMRMLKKRIWGYGEKMLPDTKVMVMGMDAANPGRVNISLYAELIGSDFLNNIEQWHADTAWCRYIGKKKQNVVNSFSLYEIIRCAFGTEQGDSIECDKDKKVMRDTLLRLIPCVTEGRRIPADILHGLYAKASNPLAYKKASNFRTVLETACGMIRRSKIEENKFPREGEYLMAYDPNNTDRSYLYGCLLAIADKAEGEAYDSTERNNRVTNARRYWNAFSQHPYQTWGVIRERLNPYLRKLGKSQVKYLKRIDDILDKMTPAEFGKNSRLENMYLLGYSHYTTMMFNEDNAQNKEEN